MFLFKRIKIRTHEMGLYFRDGEFKGLLRAGSHWLFDPLSKVRVEIVSLRAPWLVSSAVLAAALTLGWRHLSNRAVERARDAVAV